MYVDLVPLAGIVCGTGMITVIVISIARTISRAMGRKETERIANVLARLESLEARLAAQDEEVRRLQEENRFINRLLKSDDKGDP